MSRGAATAGRVRSTCLTLSVVVLVGTLVLWFIGLFALDQGAKYGQVSIPGSRVVHLPAGEVDLSFGAQLLSSGSGNNYLPIPSLSYTVLPVRGGLVPGAQRSVGATTSVNGDAHRRFAKIDVPAAGSYRVQVSGDVSAFFDPALEFGAPNPAVKILLIGGTLFFWLVLASMIARLVQTGLPASTPGSQASAAIALGARARPSILAAGVPYRLLTVAAIGAVALPALLLAGGKLHIAPQGRVTPAGQLISGASSSSGQVDLIRGPLPRPTGANVIGAASFGSLFRTRNLSPVLATLEKALGARASITNLAIYPGEIDLVVDDAQGMLRRVRIEGAGAVTEGPSSPVISSPVSIYISQLDATVPQLLVREIAAGYDVPMRRLDRIVLVTDLTGGNAGWQIFALSPTGQPGATFEANLDGSNLARSG